LFCRVQLAAVNIVGRGNFSEMVTSSYSMSPSPTVSPSWSATQSVSVSQEPAALVHKNNLNHDIAIASFTVFGVAAAGLVVFALLRWRMQRKQASVIQPFDDLSKYEPPQVTPGATAPPEPDRDSDGSGNPPIRPVRLFALCFRCEIFDVTVCVVFLPRFSSTCRLANRFEAPKANPSV
jgi:hypothetical protein